MDIQNPDYAKEQVEVNSHCVSVDSYLSQHHPLLQFIRIWHLCGAFREPLDLLHCTRLEQTGEDTTRVLRRVYEEIVTGCEDKKKTSF